ncbi:MAG: hypothetical protein ACRC0R_07095 [Cetobacterium sp.]
MIEKIVELKKIMSEEDILANIFLNYSSYAQNDIVFILKKLLSKKLKIDMKDIRLIGSGHTGFSINRERTMLEKKEVIKDYDFVIINERFFEKMYNYISSYNLYLEGNSSKYPVFKDRKIKSNKELFEENYKRGKLHLRYVKKVLFIVQFCKELEKLLLDKYEIELKVSCCIYKSEKVFLENQNKYYMKKTIEGYSEILKVSKEV